MIVRNIGSMIFKIFEHYFPLFHLGQSTFAVHILKIQKIPMIVTFKCYLFPISSYFILLLNQLLYCILQVFVRLKGTKGKFPKKHLTKKAGSVKSHKSVPFKFGRGTTHVFKLNGPELGELKSLIIEVSICVYLKRF